MIGRPIPWALWVFLATGCAKDTTPAVFGGTDDSGASTTAATTGTTGSAESSGTTGGGAITGADTGSDDGGAEAPKYDVMGVVDAPAPEGCGAVDGDVTVSGLVTAPEGTIPIPGALVYVAQSAPDPIPDHVYCDECVQLECSVPHTFTQPDGSFELTLPSGDGYLVVQKGQFRRVTAMDFDADATVSLSAEVTRLPAERDEEAGLSAPKIALGWGVWDPMENLLAELLGTDVGGFFVPGEHGFDFYERSFTDGLEGSVGSFHDLLADLDALRQYHIVFAACYGDFFTAEELDNLRTWVSEGGRLYATDLEASDLMSSGFGDYQTFGDVGGLLGVADPWPGRVEDDGLLAWLSEQGFGEHVELHGNASQITSLLPVFAEDEDGNEIDVGHQTLLSAQATDGFGLIEDEWSPAAVMGQLGCGRIAYTTYHTHSHGIGLQEHSAQELTMLYLMLEIGVCQEFVPEPEG